MKLSLGYLTFPTKSEAKNMALALLKERLIACANILPGAESYFVWENKIEKANETVVLLKTRTSNEDKIIRFIKEHHSYKCPCVVFVSLDHGNPEFLRWIEASS